jgi:glucokinase
MDVITVGVDIGGTKIQAAAVRNGSVAGSHRASTPKTGAKDLVATVGEAITKSLAETGADLEDLSAIGIGVPGAVDTAAGTVSNSPNLPGFQGADQIPLAKMVSAVAGNVIVKLDNDVRVAILGEWKRGAGRPFRNLLGVWVGTGVGGGLVLNGELYQGTGAAGEIGHTNVKPGGRVCSDRRKGHLEAYAGRGRIEAEARERVKDGQNTILFELMEKKGRTRLSSGIIATALERGDKLAEELIDDAVWALGVACASVQNLLALEAIIIGGGLGDRLGEPFVDRVARQMRPQLFVPEAPPEMLTPAFGDLSGAVGGAVLAEG